MASRLLHLGDILSGWPRRLAAAVCAVLAAGSALGTRSHASAVEPKVPVVVAARDIAPGAVLANSDVRLALWPKTIRPSGVAEKVPDVVGRQVAGAIQSGEALVSTRLIDGAITAGLPPGMVAAPVALSGIAAAGFLQAGQRVDLLSGPSTATSPTAAEGSSSAARMVAEAVRVLAVTPGSSASVGDTSRIVVAVDRLTALRLAAAADGTLLVTIRTPP